MISNFVKGQRWVSSMEPELGLGIVDKFSGGRVQISFLAREETRIYTPETAPLKRVHFAKGDIIETRQGRRLEVAEILERDDLYYYVSGGKEICEQDLADHLSFNKPHDRLLAGHADEMDVYHLRHRTLLLQHKVRCSKLRGFSGGRMELVPHQLFVAQEVTERYAPRVLLADEVGLGKTIEASLILHRLIQTGRVQRAIVLVPESLLHQWFVELHRRFQLTFSILDEEECAAIEAESKKAKAKYRPKENPFEEKHLALCATDFLAKNSARAKQALEAGWDMLIVDEAHHLEWSSKRSSAAYNLVEKLAQKVRRLLLITAIPEQLGREGHFARLRLLDPERYTTLEAFEKESAKYRDVARLADGLLGQRNLTQRDWQQLRKLFSHYPADDIAHLIEGAAMEDRDSRLRLLEDLLDQHGTGRVMFRNRRASIGGFPQRRLNLVPLKPTRGSAHIEWLVNYLQEIGSENKVLLITSTPKRVEQVAEKVRAKTGAKIGTFHEGMTLLERDRSAAYFAEEDGAQLLICSEFGSEGRNFQFAHRLVLLDLPQDPSMLEQRIGRLDRIGQTETIQIFVPYLQQSGEEVLVRWYHEALDAFESFQQSGHLFVKEFGKTLEGMVEKADLNGKVDEKRLGQLIADTKEFQERTNAELKEGRDHLLELSSFADEPARKLVDEISKQDQDTELEMWFLDMLDFAGVAYEEIGQFGQRTFHIRPDNLTEAFPSLPKTGLTITFDRATALKREDYQFVTWDHPLVKGAMDMLLGSERGNCSFAYLEATGPKRLFLEAIYVVECIAPTHLHADRFLPATPIRALVDHRGEDYTAELTFEGLEEYLRPGKAQWVQKNISVLSDLLPKLQEFATKIVEKKAKEIIRTNRSKMRAKLQAEVDRLRHLRKINDHVRADEVSLAEESLRELDRAFDTARPRLESLRILFKGDD